MTEAQTRGARNGRREREHTAGTADGAPGALEGAGSCDDAAVVRARGVGSRAGVGLGPGNAVDGILNAGAGKNL